MPVASARSAVVAFGRQTAEGSALATPKYEIPMGEGFVGPARTVEELPWTSEQQDSLGDFVSKVEGQISVTIPLLPISCVPVLQGVLGSRATTGAGPYTHAITPADTLPWMTWFYKQPGDDFWTLSDAKIGEWELGWEAGQPLQATITGAGKTALAADSKWGAATLAEGVDPFFTFIGATVKFDHSSTPATTIVRNVSGGSISVNRNLDPIQTDGIGNQYIAEQKREYEVSFDDAVWEDNNLIRTIFTGSTSGTTMSGAVVYGSAELTFLGSDQAAAATRSLKIGLPRVLWSIDQIPGANPDGSTLRYTVTGKISRPAAGAAITATVINGDAGTNY